MLNELFDIGNNMSDVITMNYSGIVSGIATGLVAMFIYRIQKCVDYKSNTQDNAYILSEEIRRNAKHREPGLRTSTQTSKMSQKNEVYIGLLHTGNIKYFDADLQEQLDTLYIEFEKKFDISFDIDLLIKVNSKLNNMKKYGKRQCIKCITLRKFTNI